ncbi:hypothetical protein DFH11DRAFT_1501983 [Phellopilus nigrolimitatus]|nr:hypothetical protein DFH11DRAFT_1501983 [Phellopilus nigrolimitatus]
METRPSSSSVAKAPGLFSTSASASFHSRLTVSSSSSQRRLRTQSRADSDELPPHKILRSPVILHSLPSSPRTSSLPLHCSEKASRPLRHTLLFWTLSTYCLFSVAFFTMRLFVVPKALFHHTSRLENQSISPINDFSHSFRLSRILQFKPQPISFFPYIVHAEPSDSNITACLWIELKDLKSLCNDIGQGPSSVVVVTEMDPRQAQSSINALKAPSGVSDMASFHIIHQLPHEIRTSNSYLNLARMFARTRYVVLFPSSTETSIPKGLNIKLAAQMSALNASRLVSPFALSSSKFTANSPIPFPPLAPVFVEQTYPIWCSERFFTAPSRAVDWEECLWQFWLNSYGSLSTLAETSWSSFSNKTKDSAIGPLSAEDIIHRRLSNRFRHESCVLAAKRLKDRSSKPGKVDPRKAQWLRKTCRQVSIGLFIIRYG